MAAISKNTLWAILAVVLVALVGVFVLAGVGVIPGADAVQFAQTALAAFFGAVVGQVLQMPKSTLPRE